MRCSSSSSSIAIECSEPSTGTSSTDTPASVQGSREGLGLRERDQLGGRVGDEERRIARVDLADRGGLDRRRAGRRCGAPEVGELHGRERLAGVRPGEVGRAAEFDDRGHACVDR